jgi:uncharacterized lipoprotein YajG
MKNLKTIFGTVIFASFMLTSCSQKPTEIKLSDLDTVCDYVDAIEKCVDAIIEIKDDKTDISELPEEKQEYARQLMEKLRQIEKAGEKKFTNAEAKECKNYEAIKNKRKSL